VSYRYRCRCYTACDTRVSLKRKLEDYIRKPKCRCCGGELRRDRARELESKRNVCHCGELPFPHRKGCKWCRRYKGEYTDQDYEDRKYAYQ